MKNAAVKQLIKDIAILAIAWLVFGIVFSSLDGSGMGWIMGFVCAGVPFGWKWLSKIFTALSFYTIIVKFMLAIFLGWIAVPIIIIKDIIGVATAI